jgi:hypothetical protein
MKEDAMKEDAMKMTTRVGRKTSKVWILETRVVYCCLVPNRVAPTSDQITDARTNTGGLERHDVL